MCKFPEHESLAGVRDQSQSIGEFLEWLGERGIRLGRFHEHTKDCVNPEWHDDVNKGKDRLFSDDWVPKYSCGYDTDEFAVVHYNIENLLAEYFEIDLDKLEKEERQILEQLRKRAG